MGEGLPDLTERLRLSRRGRRWRQWVSTIVVGVVLVVCLAAALVVRYSSLLDVRQVSVSGVSLVAADQVRTRAGVTLGAPMAGVDSAAVAARVASLLPVGNAVVERSWPHTIRIKVTERRAVFQRQAPHEYQWVDRTGVIFHTVATADPNLPTATTTSVENALLGDVATVVAALPAQIRGQLTLIQAPTQDSITLVLRDGRRIVWGDADQSALKAQVAVGLLAIPARVYDVSSPANPTSR